MIIYSPDRDLYRYLPGTEEEIISTSLWKTFSAPLKIFTLPIRCISCQKEVSYFDAVGVNTSRRGRSGAIQKEDRGNVLIGCLVHVAEDVRTVPNGHTGEYGTKDLEVCHWKVVPMTIRGYGCIPCQVRMTHLRHGRHYIDVRERVLALKEER